MEAQRREEHGERAGRETPEKRNVTREGDKNRTDQAPLPRILQASWGFRRASDLLASGLFGMGR